MNDQSVEIEKKLIFPQSERTKKKPKEQKAICQQWPDIGFEGETLTSGEHYYLTLSSVGLISLKYDPRPHTAVRAFFKSDTILSHKITGPCLAYE